MTFSLKNWHNHRSGFFIDVNVFDDDANEIDRQVRLAAFRFLESTAAVHGDVLDRALLERGFEFQGRRVRLVGPQGIFKPDILPYFPLSILTVAPRPGKGRPYDDGFQYDGSVVYRYRGTDPRHHENVRLRRAMENHVALVYFHGIVPGRYVAAWPVYIVGDDPGQLSFVVDVDGPALRDSLTERVGELPIRRSYAVRTVRQRLHQERFRERVVRAYREQCAICKLRHAELLDAAHIIPDADSRGEPAVSNGLSLCKLHHAAFDAELFGIRPDFVIEVQRSVLDETDGPMLRHGLQEIHGTRIVVPRRVEWRPAAEALEVRYARFLEGAG